MGGAVCLTDGKKPFMKETETAAKFAGVDTD